MQVSQELQNTQPSYKHHYLQKVEDDKSKQEKPFWINEDGMHWGARGGTNETLQGHGVDIHKVPTEFPAEQLVSGEGGQGHSGAPTTGLLTKVTCCHDIWMSNQYATPEWRPRIYESMYKKDFTNNLQDAVRLNPEIASKENNSQRTQISEYSNALHNKGDQDTLLAEDSLDNYNRGFFLVSSDQRTSNP